MSLKDYIENKPVLETERLTLRTLCRDDVPALREWKANPEIYKYWGMNIGKNDKNPELMFEKAERPTKSFHWGIICRADGKAIGEMWMYLIEKDRRAKVGFRLSPDYQGNGLAYEALKAVTEFCFTKTELQSLWTDVHVDNIASYKTLEKAGFRRVELVKNGKLGNLSCDYYLYELQKTNLT